MMRFLTGFIMAIVCHVAVFMAPIHQKPVTAPNNNHIRVRFSIKQPLVPKPKPQLVPPPPEAVTPLVKRIEKTKPKKKPTVQPKQKPKPKPKRVKKKIAKKIEPQNPPPPKIFPDPPVVSMESDELKAPVSKPPENSAASSPKRQMPKTQTAAVAVREAYPRNEGNPPPKYPVLARRRGWEGTVELLVAVSAEGMVDHVAVSKSSGFPVLDDAAVKAVTKYRFVPGLQGDKTVAMQVKVPVQFRLQDN